MLLARDLNIHRGRNRNYAFAIEARGEVPPAAEINTVYDAERYLKPYLFDIVEVKEVDGGGDAASDTGHSNGAASDSDNASPRFTSADAEGDEDGSEEGDGEDGSEEYDHEDGSEEGTSMIPEKRTTKMVPNTRRAVLWARTPDSAVVWWVSSVFQSSLFSERQTCRVPRET